MTPPLPAPVRARAALLTAPGQGGIAVVRLEGGDAARVLSPMFASARGISPAECPPGKILYGTFAREGETLDEVLVCRVPGPETAFEINCHGGTLPAKRVLEGLAAMGVPTVRWDELCQPHAGSGDAVRAEAERLLPSALTLATARMLLAQRRGALSAAVEAAAACLPGQPDRGRAEIRRLVEAGRHGLRLAAPGRVALAGRPNAGKSSLANALLRRDRILVHESAGTTRDVIESLCEMAGVPAVLADMAGLRDAEDEVERLGVSSARAALERADVVVTVLDASRPLHEEDRLLLEATRHRARVVALNKTDLPLALDKEMAERLAGEPLLDVSARTGAGLEALEKGIASALAGPAPDLDGPVPFLQRHTDLLVQALDALSRQPPATHLAAESLQRILRG